MTGYIKNKIIISKAFEEKSQHSIMSMICKRERDDEIFTIRKTAIKGMGSV
jgi:hypothetical protein